MTPWDEFMGTLLPPTMQRLGLRTPPQQAPAPPMGPPIGGGPPPAPASFSAAALPLPRQVERGRDPFAQWLETYGMGRTPPPEQPFGLPGAAAPPEAEPFFLGGPATPSPSYDGGVAGQDPGTMQREMMLEQRFPRAMARLRQLQGMSQRRGY